MVQIGRKITKPVAYVDDGRPKPLYTRYHRDTIQRDLIDLGYYVDPETSEAVRTDYQLTHGNYAPGELPVPHSETEALREDLVEFGYCLVSDALSTDQLVTLRQRLDEQAAGERAADVASFVAPDNEGVATSQFVLALANKGECFTDLVEFRQRTVQKGVLLEGLLDEILGRDCILNSLAGAIAGPDGIPQMLHCGQSMIPKPWPPWPYECFVGYLLDDFNEENGGTLVLPRSHQIFTEAVAGPVAELPPTASVTAPAGSALIMDGRLAHGTGANRSESLRRLIISTWHKPFVRQQEQYGISLDRHVYERASQKLLARLGFQVWHGGLGGYEGHGEGSVAPLRNDYVPVSELSPSGEPVNGSKNKPTIARTRGNQIAKQQLHMRARGKLITG